jgi:hypothetical protein
MTELTQQEPSLLLRIKERIGSPPEWSNADRCLFASLIVFTLAFAWNLWDFYFLSHHEEIPYIADEYSERFLPIQLVAFTGGWFLIVVASLWARRYAPDTRFLIYVLVQYFAIGFTFVTYIYGTFTSNFGGSVLLGGAVVGFLLFDKGPMLGAIASAVTVLVGTTIASQAGLMPYAPFMAGAPYENGHLSGLWMASYGAMNYTVFFVAMGIVYFIFYRWREQEEQLERANELISRYVAAQVSERILAGDYDAVNNNARRTLKDLFSDVTLLAQLSARASQLQERS